MPNTRYGNAHLCPSPPSAVRLRHRRHQLLRACLQRCQLLLLSSLKPCQKDELEVLIILQIWRNQSSNSVSKVMSRIITLITTCCVLSTHIVAKAIELLCESNGREYKRNHVAFNPPQRQTFPHIKLPRQSQLRSCRRT